MVLCKTRVLCKYSSLETLPVCVRFCVCLCAAGNQSQIYYRLIEFYWCLEQKKKNNPQTILNLEYSTSTTWAQKTHQMTRYNIQPIILNTLFGRGGRREREREGWRVGLVHRQRYTGKNFVWCLIEKKKVGFDWVAGSHVTVTRLRPSLPHLITCLLLPGTAVMQEVETMLALASVTVLGVLEQGEPQPITAIVNMEGAVPSGA